MDTTEKFGPSDTCAKVQQWIESRQVLGQPMVIDLGCGTHKVAGAFGIDVFPLSGVDMVHDLKVIPYPFPDNCAERIYLNHVIEHFSDPLPILQEAWRLASPDGTIFIRTPHYSSRHAWKDPTHQRSFSSQSFDYFGENEYSYYTGGAHFNVIHVRLKYFMEEKCWPKPYRLFGHVVQWLLDRHLTFSERFLCYLVGGIDELQVTLQVVKSAS
ncbi:MAG TPA: class I SAM-dependent methyltransferase [bacterium]|nr:class I SAM-dependent methyltransferase [bacterium]HPR87531.1 class I SAM-dependent methyltransferase [bacterium]